MGTTIKHPLPDRVKLSFVIFWHPGTLTISLEPNTYSTTAKNSYKEDVFHWRENFFPNLPVNNQNNHVWAVGKKCEVDENRLLVKRAKFALHVMVSAGVCFNGKGRLHFMSEKTKLYVNTLLPTLVADCKRYHMATGFILQQDGAPAHTARVTQDWVATNCTGFIGKDEWPPNSPELSAMDCVINHCFTLLICYVYCVWTVDNILTFWWCCLSENFRNWHSLFEHP